MVAPFQRPSIDLGAPKREWREISASSLRDGDVVRGLGLVTDWWSSGAGVVIVFKSGNQHFFTEEDAVVAFVKV